MRQKSPSKQMVIPVNENANIVTKDISGS